jgi:hypothetical protein
MSTTMWLDKMHSIYLCLLLTCLHHVPFTHKHKMTLLICLENNACKLHNMSSDSTTVHMLQIVVWLLHPLRTADTACHILLTMSLIVCKLFCFELQIRSYSFCMFVCAAFPKLSHFTQNKVVESVLSLQNFQPKYSTYLHLLFWPQTTNTASADFPIFI